MAVVKDNIPALCTGSSAPALDPRQTYSLQRAYVALLSESTPYYELQTDPARGLDRSALKMYFRFQVVNINIWQKPEWFVTLTPFGKVPVLKDTDGTIIYESLIVAEYLDDKYASFTRRLLTSDPSERAKQKMLLEVIMDKVGEQVRHVAMKNTKEAGEELIKNIEKIDALLQDDYFAGHEAGFVDLMVFPWFDRAPTYLGNVGVSFQDEQYSVKKISAWRTRMLEHPAIKGTCYSHECYQAMLDSRRSGKPSPDVGLDL